MEGCRPVGVWHQLEAAIRFSLMFATRLLCYLWDLEDEGVDDVLDRLKGDLGVDGVTVVAASGPFTLLRRGASASPRVFHSRGGVFFQPHDDAYHSTRCKPVVSGWLKARNPLLRVARACRQRGLELRAALDTRRIGRLAARYRMVAAKSAFGDAAQGCACLANPDFTELLHALIDDLSANYALSGIELRGLDRPFDTDLLDGAAGAVALGPVELELFAVCFCESSIRSACEAGIDGEAARRSAQVRLAKALETGRSSGVSLDDALVNDPVLGAYVGHQRCVHRSALRSLASRAGGPLAVHVAAGSPVEEVVSALVAGGRTPTIIRRAPASHGGACSETPDGLPLRRGQDVLAHEALIHVGEAPADDGAALVRTLKQLVDAGWDGVIVSHLGSMGPLEFKAVRQAVRFARRSAPD